MSQTATKPKTRTKVKAQRPPMYKVILLNDDYTPREFVVSVLKAVFHMGEEIAHRVRQADVDAGKQEIAIARKGLVEPGQPVLKEIEGMGVTVTRLTPTERAAFVKATKPVYDKWKGTVGADLVSKAEKAVAARPNQQ